MKKRIPNKKDKMLKLTRLCLKHFGENFEHWNWEVESGNIEFGIPRKIAAAIELPKTTIDGKICYTDPFVKYSGGCSKSLELCLDSAIQWMEWKFNKI